jgi:FKBP-type peptidyl-prolyl cis-trans isomerase SlpA
MGQDNLIARGSGGAEGKPGKEIQQGDRVRLHFALLLESGEEIDTTRRGSPATLEIGDGNLLPGFEAVLLGMKAGDDAQIVIDPEAAFGERREENIQKLRRDRFSEELPLEPGLMISFDGPGGELPGVVRRVMEREVEVDFNHPLAGRKIIFDVSVLAVG